MRHALYLALLLAPCLFAFGSLAQAAEQEVELPPGANERVRSYEPPIQVYGGPRLLVAGRSGGDDTKELGTGLGFQLGALQSWEYFGIGAELRFAWLDTFESESSERALEVMLKPTLGFAFEQLPLRLYAAVPFGVSMSLLPREGGFLPFDRSGVLGPAVGATAFASQRLGVNVEAGYQWTGPRSEPLVRRELTLALSLVYGL